MNDPLAIETQLRELEIFLLDPDVRKSERVADLLADGFIEFGSSGRIYTKEDVIAALQAESPTRRTATDFKVQRLAPHVALVTYHAHGHTEPPVHSLRSSVWEQRQGRWQMVFHQGTLVPASRAQ